MKTDKRGTPEKEAFYFGLYNCAVCFGAVPERGRVSMQIKEPIFADHAKTEIIIPAGRQSFHRKCVALAKEPK